MDISITHSPSLGGKTLLPSKQAAKASNIAMPPAHRHHRYELFYFFSLPIAFNPLSLASPATLS